MPSFKYPTLRQHLAQDRPLPLYLSFFCSIRMIWASVPGDLLFINPLLSRSRVELSIQTSIYFWDGELEFP